MDFATIDTPRVRLHYQVQGKNHSMMCRMPTTATIIDAPDYLNILIDFVNEMTSQRYADWALVAADFAPINDEVFLPIAISGLDPVTTGAVSTTGRPASQAAAQLRFEGRSTGGSKVSITLFGTNWVPGATAAEDFRLTAAENPAINNAIEVLNEGDGTNHLRAIDGQLAIWKGYANVKYNDKVVQGIRTI